MDVRIAEKKMGIELFCRFPRGKKEEQQKLRKKFVQACKRENWSEQKINNARICGDHLITGKYYGLVHSPEIFNWCPVYLSS